MSSPPSDFELYQVLQSRDPQALTQIYDCYGNLMYSLAYKILGNAHEAEDLVQEVFLSLWQRCQYQPSRGSFKTFLLVLVRSRAIDRLRSQKAASQRLEHWQALRSDAYSPLENTVATERSQHIQTALAQLPDNQHQALEMAYYKGLTQAEIAQHFGVPLGTVKSWFRLGLQKLRHALQDFVE